MPVAIPVATAVHTMETDVLVVGGGAASALAALEAAKYGRVTLIDTGKFGRSGSNASSGGQGCAASFGHFDIGSRRLCPGDTPELHFADTMRVGEGLSDPRVVTAVVGEIRDRVRETLYSGVRYGMTPDRQHFLQRGGFGHSHPRICLCGAGWDFMGDLAKEVYIREVTVRNFLMAVRLLVVDGACAGTVAVDRKSGDVWVIRAGAVVLSAGSATGLQKYGSASYQTNGDAFRLAFDAGVALADMEFMEFTMVPAPRDIVIPTSGISPYIGRGAIFFNAAGERFMTRYDPVKKESGTRAGLVQAVYQEMLAGRGPCYLDATGFAPEVWEAFYREEPDVLRKMRSLVDPRQERVPWVPALHSFLGGVAADEYGRTSLPGLYAAGEAAAGMHGASRLGGNAVAACYVIGARAGRQAARFRQQQGVPEVPRAQVQAEVDRLHGYWSPAGERPHVVETDIRETAWRTIGILRQRATLAAAVDVFGQYQQRRVRTKNLTEWLRAIELSNLSLTGEIVARAALAREESRGQHKRLDFPSPRPEWLLRSAVMPDRQVQMRPLVG